MNHFRNKTEENNMLLSSTQSSVSFYNHESMFGRKGVATLINSDSAAKAIWLVVNPQVLSFFSFNNHLEILKLYRLSNLKLTDFPFTSCFSVSLKSDEEKKETKSTDFFKQNKEELSSSMSKNKKNKLKKNDVLCFVNENEKIVWINSIKKHSFE